jgi:hypothetical protein
MNMKLMMGVLLALLCISGVRAEVVNLSDGCTSGQEVATVIYFEGNDSPVFSPFVMNNCTDTQILFIGANLTLGPILPGELEVTSNSVYVNALLRPDLDVQSVIIFNAPYVFEPNVLRNGADCGDCNSTFDEEVLQLTVVVPGFSNYSLTGRQDFTVQSDTEPVLAGKVYQTIDLGDARRAEEYKCLVQLYGKNAGGQWVLVETNPQRQVQAKLLGNPDSNQPEALGYFKTENGLANVYFNGDKVYGYENFEYVAQCANNATKLIYEENIDTRYKQPGKALVSRGVWLTDNGGINAFYGSIVVIVGFFAVLFALVIIRTWWRVLRGY